MKECRILLAEQSPRGLSPLKKALTAKGCFLDWIADGRMLLAAILKNRPQVVLLDENIPGIDSWEVCCLLKKNDNTKSIPLIMLCEFDGMPKQMQAVEMGLSGLLKKPYSIDEVLTWVERLRERQP